MNLLIQKSLQDKIQTIPGMLSLEEGLLLYRLAKKQCQKEAIVEIGSFQGRSTIFLVQALLEEKMGKIYAIDPHLGNVFKDKKTFSPTYKKFLSNVHRFKATRYIQPIRKRSLEAKRTWKKRISLLFVDGLHDYESVRSDLKAWLPYLAENGIIACHDAFAPQSEVFQAVKEEIFQKKQLRFVSFANSIIYAIQGKPRSLFEAFKLRYNIFVLTNLYIFWSLKGIPLSVSNLIVTALKKLLVKEKVFDSKRDFLSGY